MQIGQPPREKRINVQQRRNTGQQHSAPPVTFPRYEVGTIAALFSDRHVSRSTTPRPRTAAREATSWQRVCVRENQGSNDGRETIVAAARKRAFICATAPKRRLLRTWQRQRDPRAGVDRGYRQHTSGRLSGRSTELRRQFARNAWKWQRAYTRLGRLLSEGRKGSRKCLCVRLAFSQEPLGRVI